MSKEMVKNREKGSSSSQSVRLRKVVYSIQEKGAGKSYWLRIGTAFVNKDSSLSVYLDAIPTNGKLHIRDVSSSSDLSWEEENHA